MRLGLCFSAAKAKRFFPLRTRMAGLLVGLWSCSSLAAPPQLETLKRSEPSKGLMQACASDKLCVELDLPRVACADQGCGGAQLDDATLSVLLPQEAAGAQPAALALVKLSLAEDVSTVEPWEQLIRFDGGVLAGVKAQTRAMYSGGWAHATTLHLIAFLPGQEPFEVLQVPLKADKGIRACFSEKDFKQRAGACHDEYAFVARLTPGPSNQGSLPSLMYRSKATTFPGGVSLSRDSLAAPPLRKRDIVRQIDPTCSYQRAYRFDTTARAYATQRAEPDCSEYTAP